MGQPSDIGNVFTTPEVDKAYYQTHAWHTYTSADEVNLDCKDLPEHERDSLLTAFHAYRATAQATPSKPTKKAKDYKRIHLLREASAQERRQYMKQFHEAK